MTEGTGPRPAFSYSAAVGSRRPPSHAQNSFACSQLAVATIAEGCAPSSGGLTLGTITCVQTPAVTHLWYRSQVTGYRSTYTGEIQTGYEGTHVTFGMPAEPGHPR